MAHSHEQSLLARLGFADPDRKDKRHTLACQYLCEPEVARRVIRAVGITTPSEPVPEPKSVVVDFSGRSLYDKDKYEAGKPELSKSTEWISKVRTGVEMKVEGSRGFLIGFVDVFIEVHKTKWTRELEKLPEGRGESQYWTGNKWWYYPRASIAHRFIIEVKATPVDVADAIKQLKMYSVAEPTHTVLATCYPMTQADKGTLNSSGIYHIYLGDGFKAYCAKRAQEKPVEEEGI